MPIFLWGQSLCDLGNFESAYAIAADEYPYFSLGSGITVNESSVGVSTLSNVTYSCGGQAFETKTPAWWLNNASQSITLTFSEPVSSFSVVVNGTASTEEFYFDASAGSISLSNFCTTGFTTINGGTALLCNSSSSAGTLITINNPVGATTYTLSHNGLEAGSRISVLDCFVPVSNIVTINAWNFCIGDSTLFDFNYSQVPDSLVWNFGDPSSGAENTSTDTMPYHVFTDTGLYEVTLIAYSGDSVDTGQVVITIYKFPEFSLGSDTSICIGNSLVLDPFIASAGYLWQNGATFQTFWVNQPGTYWLEVTENGCSTSDTINISNVQLPNFNLGNDTTLCPGEIIMLHSLGSAITYLWQDSSTDSILNVYEPGEYWVEASFICGVVSDTVSINYYDPLVLDIGNDTTLCDGDDLLLDATTSNASYLWQDNSVNSTFLITQPGLYGVSVSNICETISDGILVNYQSPPYVNLGNDTSLCPNEAILLNASAAGASYLWQNGYTGSSIAVTHPGIYQVTISIGKCSSHDQITVSYFPEQKLDLGEDDVLCDEEDQIRVESNITGSYYLWNTGSNESSILVDTPNIYTLQMLDVNACPLFDSVHIGFHKPLLTLMEDQEICLGELLQISAMGDDFITYHWNTGSEEPFITINDEGTYTVYAIDSNNCIAEDTVHIKANGCSLYVPNTFTPNGDRINDHFLVKGEGIQNFEMIIYNRFGEEVFQSNDILEGWPGIYKGKPSPMGVYAYTIQFVVTSSLESRKMIGYFSLVP